MTRITVFGAGAMGTAFAMHLARAHNDTRLWASPYDDKVLGRLLDERRHPALPEHLPDSLEVLGPDDLERAGEGMEIAVMGAHSGGARNLAQLVKKGCDDIPLVVGVAKGLEPDTGKRMSEVFVEEVGHDQVISVGGPCLAGEVAEGLPTAAVFASADVSIAEKAASSFRSRTLHVAVVDDVVGVEYCTVAKNVAAIGMGIVDGLGKGSGRGYENAKSALFTKAFHEMTELVSSLGGRRETVLGLAGIGDTLVTSLGGRNRLFGEMIGEGVEPKSALEDMGNRGMTVEGWDSARDIGTVAERAGVELPFFHQVHAILFASATPESVFDSLSTVR
ncbi:MAG TPA: NAD(P)H-dependent glycerol-3-phosphate dehydrogenase [Actinomycetota bacterium]|nr:NAD(P)H-dependent glycerol-3-phosphate dehydrogenase [Actinomycetota bacterium]